MWHHLWRSRFNIEKLIDHRSNIFPSIQRLSPKTTTINMTPFNYPSSMFCTKALNFTSIEKLPSHITEPVQSAHPKYSRLPNPSKATQNWTYAGLTWHSTSSNGNSKASKNWILTGPPKEHRFIWQKSLFKNMSSTNCVRELRKHLNKISDSIELSS